MLNELQCVVEGREPLGQVSDFKFLKRDSAPWGQFVSLNNTVLEIQWQVFATAVMTFRILK
jgi:hypothetical protein